VRVTDDPPKDRNPTWSPDGSRLGFMSSRSGEWELWSVRKDGSDLRQMTDLRSGSSIAVWSPDGKQVATTSTTFPPTGLWVFDSSTTATRQTARFFKDPLTQPFSVESWSADGKMMSGSLLDSGGFPNKIAVRDVATGAIRALNIPLPTSWPFYFVTGGWLPDSRRFFAHSTSGLVLVDSMTGAATPVQTRAAGRYDVANHGRTLMLERMMYDADVWLMEVKR
jgi:Tol biopolymer transport system component